LPISKELLVTLLKFVTVTIDALLLSRYLTSLRGTIAHPKNTPKLQKNEKKEEMERER